MKKQIFLLTTFVLAAMLVVTGTVFAEGEEPPVVPATPAIAETTAPVIADEEIATQAPENPAQETPAAEIPIEEIPDGDPLAETVLEEIPAEDALLETAPGETGAAAETEILAEEAEPAVDIVVINEEGEPLALASEEAAQELAAPDP